jgi:hypothetical protein
MLLPGPRAESIEPIKDNITVHYANSGERP